MAGEMPEAPAGWAHAQVRTGSDGAFSLGRLAEVRYALWVEGPPDTLARPPVRVRAPASGVVVSLTSGASPTVTVLDESGQPIANAVVWALDQTGVPLRPTPPGRGRFAGFIARTGPRGDATLRGLDPDRRVLLDVRPPDGDTRWLPVRFPDWLPGELTVRLDEGRRVNVDVHELDGMPAAKAWVQWKNVEVKWKNAEDPHDPWRAAEASGDGAFVTGNVRSAARVALRARIRQDGKPGHYRRAAAVVPAGATKAALTLAPSPSLRVFVEGARPEERVEVEIGDESVAGSGRSQSRSARAGEGETVFNDLWPGTTYAVRAQGSGGRRAWTQGTPADAGEVRVKLEAGLTARGHVDGPAGLSVERVVARVWGFHVLGTAAGGSSFEIAGLPPGPFCLGVTLRDSHGNLAEAHGHGVHDGENMPELRPR